jgi:hypothetical protein
MPRFVILEHCWNGVHWDFMLEVDGALKTWAIDSPIRPGLDLPARRLADHRLAYLEYEGAVSGGRGSVSRFDRGTYEPVSWSGRCVRVELRGARFRGRAELTKEDDQSDDECWRFRFEDGNLD